MLSSIYGTQVLRDQRLYIITHVFSIHMLSGENHINMTESRSDTMVIGRILTTEFPVSNVSLHPTSGCMIGLLSFQISF